MSKYASFEEIGEDESGLDGTVVQYQGSHVFPHIDHPAAALGLASIPGWCVPGAEDDDDADEGDARWLRLHVRGGGEMVTSTIVIHEVAARKLRDQLTDWLQAPKVDPPATNPEVGG